MDPEGNPRQRRAILICVDGSACSRRAVDWAALHMIRRNDVVILMTVWEETLNLKSAADLVQLGVPKIGMRCVGVNPSQA